ncbi:hypothetical protein SKAU_G00308950 [Synaphobranchus kaupii]|uniref:Uncharacterized protein n=1 Tax=Synaphobranchus kaupii TaxID=118154 RepID=A0A9Q1ER95_SYNKA|nr:hypothetical protein SKAU_G00308950 [Synaphobranchus kaupii]
MVKGVRDVIDSGQTVIVTVPDSLLITLKERQRSLCLLGAFKLRDLASVPPYQTRSRPEPLHATLCLGRETG